MSDPRIIEDWGELLAKEIACHTPHTAQDVLWVIQQLDSCDKALEAIDRAQGMSASLPRIVREMKRNPDNLKTQLFNHLDTLLITDENIGAIRNQLFVPWVSKWNDIVRDETAAREK